MPLTSPYNINSPGVGDGPPDSVTLGAMAASVNTALANTFGAHVQIKPVTNTTTRASYLASFGTPTSARPCAVFRANATPGKELEYTVNGTTWTSLYNVETAWVTPTFQNGWGGFARYRRDAANNLHIQARLTTIGTSSTSLPAFTLPSGFRITVPDFLRLPVGTNTLASNASAYYTNDGRVCIAHTTPGYISIAETFSLV